MTDKKKAYGETAIKLVKEAIRTKDHPNLPVYKDDIVRDVLLEIKYLFTSLKDIQTVLIDGIDDGSSIIDLNEEDIVKIRQEKSNGLGAASVLHSAAIQRNKQCLLAYQRHRLERLIELLWSFGGGCSTATTLDPETRKHLAPHELDFISDYKSLCSEYRGHFLDIDLGAALVPPKDMFVEIRVLKDCGDIMTESGFVSLVAGTQHYLKRTDVEDLIIQGFVEHI